METSIINPAPSSVPGTLEPISIDESRRLLELENIIEAGKRTFVRLGNALAEIRDGRLYRSDYRSFETYCKVKWNFTKQHAYRLMACAPIAESNLQVTTFNQARALAKVPEEQRATVVQAATTTASSAGRKLTAQHITEAAQPSVATPSTASAPCPSAKTQRQLTSWYFKATKAKRGQFLNLILTTCPVVVEDKEKFKKQIDRWLEQFVSEVPSGSVSVISAPNHQEDQP